jgi:branched-chain amino acid transport system ATP-binding protein
VSLRIRAVTAGYGATDVLRGVDLVVPPGKSVALLGANGAGKTTLLKVCSGLLDPRAGSISLDGRDVTGATPHRLATLGLCHIPEGRAVFPALTVAENLRLLAGSNRDDAVDRVADGFPVLGRKLRQTAGTLSGGEQQLLALMRAYVTEPRYVLLDEVSMGLAPIVVDDLFDLLERLSTSGVALLIVEQYVAKALSLADLCFVMQAGELVFGGEPSEIDREAVGRSYLGADAEPTFVTTTGSRTP